MASPISMQAGMPTRDLSMAEDEDGTTVQSAVGAERPEGAGEASGRAGYGRATGRAQVPDLDEWETSSPPPSVLLFRTLVLRRAEPSAGRGDEPGG